MGEAPLAEEHAARERLTEKLSGLALLPVQGRTSSAAASAVAGRTYQMDSNALKIETIALHGSETGWMVRITTAGSEETIPCGYGVWAHGRTALFRGDWVMGPTPTVASGAWTADDEFTMVVRLYETPFYHTLVCHFIGDELLVEARVNTSLEVTKPLLLTGHAV